MLAYIHGYQSNGLSFKARHFKRTFGTNQVFCPSLPDNISLAINTLEQWLETQTQPVGLIGASLGGFYALYLAEKFQIPAVLINPAIPPLAPLGDVTDQTSQDQRFIWTAEVCKALEPYFMAQPSERTLQSVLLLQQMDDEVLDPKRALSYLQGASIHRAVGGGHKFEKIGLFDKQISQFMQRHGVSVSLVESCDAD
ncbi:YqiA/YcfP family alpha/beta fold hydrolase [Thiomicrospira sp. ALE5]|uniref:YqiA/YcfP family alpha/beta fold hydrolase n=1 Tax=Thiomicrospira sp. ALE5 TaxID=748650 RepID=UPI0008DECD80|nr:YqiA/YcfP family alpha/beta fold hydrolase [Thiomicrospira sp. ALE5]SFR51773.1 hypothetical protein SAMN03092900_0567 [Thiomicrospira sp. ALE5]